MNVGIYTRWQRRDSTYAAIQVADLLSQWQHDVAILTPTPTKPPVSSFWDARVARDALVRFTDWAESRALVIWTFCPDPAQLNWIVRAGKRAIVVPDWADLHLIDEVSALCWRIYAPTLHWARVLEGRGARNVVLCPWSPVLPITIRTLVPPVRVYVPPVDRPGEDDELAVDVVEGLLALDRAVVATVSIDGRRGALAKRLDRLAHIEPRLTLDRPLDYHHQILRYGDHSLTLLSAVVENFAIPALCSFHMGTPVIGFNAPTLAEAASPQNAVLVDCGAAPAAVDCRDLLEALMVLVEPSRLSQLFSGCAAGLAQRRLGFESAWRAAVSRTVWRR
jgi:glycosyltransferase involved in cell wall biosynthesis